MTSNDTLGTGISGNVSTILPSVGLNGTIPSGGDYIPRPWKSKVTTVEAGIGTPNVSPAITATYTPQQIADFLVRYVFPLPSGGGSKDVFVRDSAAAAGVPSRYNVFEYGFPGTGPALVSTDPSGINGEKHLPTVFDTGAAPVPFSSSALLKGPRGLPGLLAEVGLMDRRGE